MELAASNEPGASRVDASIETIGTPASRLVAASLAPASGPASGSGANVHSVLEGPGSLVLPAMSYATMPSTRPPR
jgi:hypothetical protein